PPARSGPQGAATRRRAVLSQPADARLHAQRRQHVRAGRSAGLYAARRSAPRCTRRQARHHTAGTGLRPAGLGRWPHHPVPSRRQLHRLFRRQHGVDVAPSRYRDRPGDGGAHYGLICDASYTTHALTYWMRDRRGGERLPLAWTVQQLTDAPARAVGLGDRGRLVSGYRADLNVIDLDRLKVDAPHPVHNLPGGGRRLEQKAEGYRATVVGGEVTYRDGEFTGALPGRLVRGAR